MAHLTNESTNEMTVVIVMVVVVAVVVVVAAASLAVVAFRGQQRSQRCWR